MPPFVSIIIPNFNGESTIENCLRAVFASDYPYIEVIVVDDHSEDDSVNIIKRFPCQLIALEKHSGAAAARNIGANKSHGKILFFTDADCVLNKHCIKEVYQTLLVNGPDHIVGGTYTRQPFDDGFFSKFQSIFINYSETKHLSHPDYIATHAMGIFASTFNDTDGFKECWLPILEDVEFSHRLRRSGYQLRINPQILVQHIFNFSLKKSIVNALKKSSYWTLYSISNKDLFSDSGTASYELKANVILFYLTFTTCLLFLLTGNITLLALSGLFTMINIIINRYLLKAFKDTYGATFSLLSAVYYLWIFPIPVSMGGIIGLIKHFQTRQVLVINK